MPRRTRLGQDRSALIVCTRSNSPALMQINRKLWTVSFFCDVAGSLSLKCLWQVLQDKLFHMRPRFEAHRDTATRLPRGGTASLCFMILQEFAGAQPAFLTQNLHQPFGLISPSTSVHAFGSWNSEQLLHS